MQTAERFFAEQGVGGVSMREMGVAAGHPVTLLRAPLEPHARHIGDTKWNFLGFLAELLVAQGRFALSETDGPDYMEGYDLIVGTSAMPFPTFPTKSLAVALATLGLDPPIRGLSCW
jgi:hypothetical protein